MDKLYENSETGCCPRFEPAGWDQQQKLWHDKLFLKDRVNCLFYVPVGFGKMVVKNVEMIKQADTLPDEPLMLCDEKSPWQKDVYIAVAKNVPNAEMTKLSGTFLTKVFEGPYKNAGKWAKQMQAYVKEKGKEAKKMYFSYTTCPKCAKYYGKNYVILLAQV